MGEFQIVSQYQPSGDQPQAIDALARGVELGLSEQTLLGVTGSGTTYTILYLTLTLINRKHISRTPIPISKRIPPPIRKSIVCATARPLRFPSGVMSSL